MPAKPKAHWTATPHESAIFLTCDFGCFRAEIVADPDGATIVEPHFLTALEPEDGHPDPETAMGIAEDAARQIALKTLAVLGELDGHRPESTKPDNQRQPLQAVVFSSSAVQSVPAE
jgi:hypothetical protein